MTAYTFATLENGKEIGTSTYYGNTADEAREYGKADLKGTHFELGEIVDEEVVK